MRHGEAEDKEYSPETSDSGRRLTPRGVVQVKSVCEFAKELGAKPSVIMTSPLARARETGEIVRVALNPIAEIRVEDSLEPDSEITRIYETLSKITARETLIVTHLPLLKRFIEDFLASAASLNIELRPGTMIKIESHKAQPESGSGTLGFLLPQT